MTSELPCHPRASDPCDGARGACQLKPLSCPLKHPPREALRTPPARRPARVGEGSPLDPPPQRHPGAHDGAAGRVWGQQVQLTPSLLLAVACRLQTEPRGHQPRPSSEEKRVCQWVSCSGRPPPRCPPSDGHGTHGSARPRRGRGQLAGRKGRCRSSPGQSPFRRLLANPARCRVAAGAAGGLASLEWISEDAGTDERCKATCQARPAAAGRSRVIWCGRHYRLVPMWSHLSAAVCHRGGG